MRHYARHAREREDRKILDLEKRSVGAQDTKAKEEMQSLLRPRLERRGDDLTPETLLAELARIRTRQER